MNSHDLALPRMPSDMSRGTFMRFRSLIHRLSGIALGNGKEGLVRARVSKRIRALGLQDYDAYLDRLMADPTGDEIIHLLDVISTNVTSFFREESHFQLLGEAASHWLAEGRRHLRLWSAACSTGEEAYSMGMVLLAKLPAGVGDLKILATDLSTRALEVAQRGIYESARAAAVPAELRVRFLEKAPEAPGHVRPVSELRRSITFARLNLASSPFPMSGPFDAIFCRNVMIYFDLEIRQQVLRELFRLLRPGGWLFVGHSESLTGLNRGFRTVAPSAYVKT